MHYGHRNICTAKDKADAFNNYFCSVFTTPSSSTAYHYPAAALNNICFTLKEVHQSLIACRPGTGADGIPGQIIHSIANSLSVHFLQLANYIINTSTYPEVWKTVDVKPLHKKGDKHDILNYRPIASLSKLSLCFERLIFKRLYDFASHKLSDKQFGFRRNRSTVTQLLLHMKLLYDSLDNNENIYTIYLDFSKAFDQVDHSVLLQKLFDFGIGGNLLSLIASYLSGRFQRVCIDGVYSDYIRVTSGVPQGSILGPLFFLIFINDLPDCCIESIPFLFADDTKTDAKCLPRLQNDLNALHAWSVANKLSFNADKTQLLWFTRRKYNLDPQPVCNLGGVDISFSKEPVKDLGIFFASDLSWSAHINKKISASHFRFLTIKRNLPSRLSQSAKTTIYKLYVLPIITYGSVIWFANRSNLHKLDKFQSQVTRWIVYKSNYMERLKTTGLLPMPLYLQYLDLVFFNNLLNNHYDIDINCYTEAKTSYCFRTTTLRSFSQPKPN